MSVVIDHERSATRPVDEERELVDDVDGQRESERKRAVTRTT